MPIKSQLVTTAIMACMVIMRTNIMHKSIFMTLMITKKKANVVPLLICFFLASCSTPGMHMDQTNKDSIYIESLGKEIDISKLTQNASLALNKVYKIGNGDQISVTVWGLPEVFPITTTNSDQNLRRVDSNGNIYFPYVGLIKASSKTQDELRNDVSQKLSQFFNDPQIDLTIARFNSQKVYLIGEILEPKKINLTDIPLSLSDAIGEVRGLNNSTSDGTKVFIIRNRTDEPRIFLVDLSSANGLILSNKFYLEDNDIVYVNAKGTTRWNRVISQFFPFSSFLNSIDNLTSSN